MSNVTLEQTREPFRRLAEEAGLLERNLTVLARPLTPEEAIGTPGRRDFPILLGRERVIEARVADGLGHAFTDSAREFLGPLSEAIELPFSDNGSRAIYLAALNATLRGLQRIEGTVHCRDDDPEQCGAEIAETLATRFGRDVKVGLIGLNPAIAAHLTERFGPEQVIITDLNPDNLGKVTGAVTVWDGKARTKDLIDAVDVVLFTGTTLVNGTYDGIREQYEQQGKTGIVYGVTASGVSHLTRSECICPCGR